MKIIGLGHKKRTGKDTLATMLCCSLKQKGLKVKNAAFASKLKAVCENVFDWAGLKDEFYYDLYPEERNKQILIGKTPREIWIEMGNKIREIYPKVWIDSLLLKEHNCDVLIISDVRYANEVDAIKNLGGKLYKVTRKSIPNTDDIADCSLDNYNGWDGIVLNDGTLDDLKTAAEELACGV